MKNWKTLFAGIAAVIGGVNECINNNFSVGVPMIITGIGLIFAKDMNVTGGTTQQ